jgi:hypothetical protein
MVLRRRRLRGEKAFLGASLLLVVAVCHTCEALCGGKCLDFFVGSRFLETKLDKKERRKERREPSEGCQQIGGCSN